MHMVIEGCYPFLTAMDVFKEVLQSEVGGDVKHPLQDLLSICQRGP